MSEWSFSASVQLAINWVSNNLLNPHDPDARPVPKRIDCGWFTKIEADPIDVACSVHAIGPDIEGVSRTIRFYVGDLMVIELRMFGLRHYRTSRRRYTEWMPREVSYLTHWHSDQNQRYYEELVCHWTDLPPAIAADD